MGRPLNKKYFGNRNVGTTGTTDDGIGGSSIASVTLAGTNSGYTTVATSTFATTPKLPGGVRATGTANMAVTNTGAVTLVDAGTGYTVGDVLTLVGLGAGTAATVTVTAITGGGGTGPVDTVTLTTAGSYSTVVDLTALAVTGGTGNDDATFTITDLKIASITITEKGSGYTAAPAVTISGTATGTAVLATDSGFVGSATNQENAIQMVGFLTGGSAVAVDIIKQVSTTRYKVTDGTLTGIVALQTTEANAAGECSIVATDSDSGTYYVTKLTAHKATVTRGTGTQFDTGSAVAWTFGAATANATVTIANA